MPVKAHCSIGFIRKDIRLSSNEQTVPVNFCAKFSHVKFSLLNFNIHLNETRQTGKYDRKGREDANFDAAKCVDRLQKSGSLGGISLSS